MKKGVAVFFLLAVLVIIIGAQQTKRYETSILHFEKGEMLAITLADIEREINFYCSNGFTVTSTFIWGDTLIIIMQRIK